jgi:tetratricopeptide (TPR) repeat protein
VTTRRPPGTSRSSEPSVELLKGLSKELESLARPGKGEALTKVFAHALSAYAEGDLPEAIRLGEQSKHLALRSASVREFLGLAYYSQGQFKEAARELAAFRRIGGSTAQNHLIADCYRASGRPEKALEYCDEVENNVPEDVYYEVQIVAAGALADQGKLEDAVKRLLRLDLQPDSALEHHLRVWYVLGDLLERMGRFSQAKRWFESVAAADADLTDAPARAAKLRPDD